MAGCGSNSTAETIDLVEHAKKSNAHATLLVTPYYVNQVMTDYINISVRLQKNVMTFLYICMIFQEDL